ncbi:MAG: antibiotic biosynthesis monooxygenase [Actinomycetota bacterium]
MPEDPDSKVVTLVAAHGVAPGKEEEFRATVKRLMTAESRFAGFLGTEFIPPVPGVQEEWVTLIRFDSQEHLQAWFDSPERKKLLDELDASVDRLDVRQVGGSFGGWFSAPMGKAVPNWKQAMAVLLMLYPAVMLITLLLSPQLKDLGLSLAASIFVGNVVSVAALTWALMPAANRVLRGWLSPDANSRTTIGGALALVAAYAALLITFGYVS